MRFDERGGRLVVKEFKNLGVLVEDRIPYKVYTFTLEPAGIWRGKALLLSFGKFFG